MKDVGVMKDEEVKFEDIGASHTPGGVRQPVDLCMVVY